MVASPLRYSNGDLENLNKEVLAERLSSIKNAKPCVRLLLAVNSD